jgi:hypothetical protein
VPGLVDDTDIFVTSDHGFSTISKHELDSTGTKFTDSYAATQTYKDVKAAKRSTADFCRRVFWRSTLRTT